MEQKPQRKEDKRSRPHRKRGKMEQEPQRKKGKDLTPFALQSCLYVQYTYVYSTHCTILVPQTQKT